MLSPPPPPRNDALYRPSVGIALFSREGLVLIAERLDHPGSWQLPQGGIDEGEDPEIAVFREMEEELGTKNARVLKTMEEWLYYEIPAHTAKKIWKGQYVGQRQKWIALEFLGQDKDIRLDAHDHPEFSAWKWVPLDNLLEYVVAFKRDVYAEVIKAFSELAR
jgi:putative (di)nucleoside polyphosphate hydrolase